MFILSEKNCSDNRHAFAQGLCAEKLVWIFMICALLGDLIETVFVWLGTGKVMSRSSVIYGPFSIVWGVGGVLLTVLLLKTASGSALRAFITGFIVGGAYEYLCSIFTEIVLGTTFWDYSNEPFNIGGRTHLTFCVYWGILSVAWIKFLYPVISRWVEKIPLTAGNIVTWFMVIFMALNTLLSGSAVLRYVERSNEAAPSNAVERFLDAHYGDARIEKIYPNMRIDSQLVTAEE